MRIVVASDSYKGCLSSREVADAVRDAILKTDPSIEVVTLCVADGGEGTVEAMVDAFGGQFVRDIATDPLGRPVSAEYGIAGDLAIIESAAVCGLTLLKPSERNPLLTSTKGLGELIMAAIGRGCSRFFIGLGGSATNDGGMGMISAQGFLEMAHGKEFTVACDVDTPYIGPYGASRVFGPQKGASPADIEVLEERMMRYARKIKEDTGVDVADMPGAGAAGGLGGAFRAYLNASLKRGTDMILDAVEFEKAIIGADLIITGEGCSDYQTVKGKTAFGILQRASRLRIPTALVSGAVKDEAILHEAGFTRIERVSPEYLSQEEAIQPDITKKNIERTIFRLLRGPAEMLTCE